MSKQTIKYPCGCEFEIIDDNKSKIKFNPNVENLPLDCPKTWDVFARGDTKGVFQLESRLGSSLSKKLKPTNIEHLAALISIMRPGSLEALIDGKSITERYIDRKNGVEEITYLHPALENALKSTYAVSIYQEQSIQIARDVAGFSLEQGDILRKSVGKKNTALMAQVKKEFIEGCKKTKIVDDEIAHTIFDIIEKSQRYSFNKCISGKEKLKRIAGGTTTYHATIEEMYNIRNNIEYAKRTGHLSLYKKWKQLNYYGYGVSMHDGRCYKNKIIDIQPAGIQQTYKITINNTHEIVVTNNHKFPTPNGEKKLSQLTVGDLLYTCDKYEPSDFNNISKFSNITKPELRKRQIVHSNTTVGFEKGYNNPGYTNGAYTQFIKNKKTLTRICDKCNTLNKRLEIHHIDGDRTNNNINNLVVLCSLCHKKEHYKNGRTKKGEKGYPIKLLKITNIQKHTIEAVFDVTMDGPHHNFVTENNIVTSNSHAVEYAFNSYLTAYVKAHFPRAFFTSYLRYSKDKQKPLDEIKELVDNAKLNKIKISPVDFRIRNPHFKSIDGVIYFGFTDIKGIGDSSINIIENNVPIIEKQLNKTCDKWTWLDFLLFMSESLNASCVRSLICCGALDYLMVPRTRMLFEYDILDRLTKKEILWLKNRYFSNNVKTFTDILELLALAPSGNKNGCGCSNKTRVEKVLALIQTLKNPPYVLEDSRSWTYGVEKELMGTPLTCDGLDDSAKNYANFSCQDFINKRKWTGPIIIAGILSGVKNITTKKHQLMAFAQISDMGGSVDLVIFPDSFEENRKFLYDDNKVLVVGHRGDRDNSFIVDKVIDA